MWGRWLDLAQSLGIGEPTAAAIWDDLAAAYAGNGRFYHNLQHIEHALNVAEQLREVAVNFTAVQLALWFHDVVYDPAAATTRQKVLLMPSACYGRSACQIICSLKSAS